MNSRERISNILEHKPVDRIGIYEHFWGDTTKEWSTKNKITPNEDVTKHFDYDFYMSGWINGVADLDFVSQTIAETEDTITTLDGNGAILKRHKKHDSTPEHIGFTVEDRETWLPKKEMIVPSKRRIDFESYRTIKALAKEENRYFCWSGVNVFEQIHPLCGHENMLVGMALDPDWIRDMVDTYTTLTLESWEMLFSKEGLPDGIFFYEDMGYKESPFMSPAMYKELIMPAHKKTMDYAHARGLKVIMHSCGFVEPLLPYMIEAGIDALQVIEVKAGMDPIRIHKNFGDKIALMGGIDVRKLYSNDRKIIDEELEKVKILMQGYGYILHSDHSIPKTVEYDNYKYFLEQGIKIGTY